MELNMKLTEAIKALRDMDQRGVYVFSKGDIEKLFPLEKDKAFEKSLQRLVHEGILERVSKGVYVNPIANSKKSYAIEDIALVMRRGNYSYVSLESILSEYGDISQIPVSRLTVMTTGPKGIYPTSYGVIEFTHTKRQLTEIMKKTLTAPGRPLRIASREAARQDLLRVGRNINMLSKSISNDGAF
jgi:predicted transcriptional regulator of viral defense system